MGVMPILLGMGATAPSAFDPSTLSNLVQLGRVGHMRTNSRIWSDNATTLVTADGSSVGAVREQIGNHYYRALPFSGGSYDSIYNGTLRNDGGVWCLENSAFTRLIISSADGFSFDVGTACHAWAWIKTNATGITYTFSDYGGREIFYVAGANDSFAYQTTVNEWTVGSSPTTPTGGWDLIQVWRGGGTAYLQINNGSPFTASAPFGSSIGNTAGIFVRSGGNQPTPSGFRIAQWGLRSVAPTSGERASLYSAGPGS